MSALFLTAEARIFVLIPLVIHAASFKFPLLQRLEAGNIVYVKATIAPETKMINVSIAAADKHLETTSMAVVVSLNFLNPTTADVRLSTNAENKWFDGFSLGTHTLRKPTLLDMRIRIQERDIAVLMDGKFMEKGVKHRFPPQMLNTLKVDGAASVDYIEISGMLYTQPWFTTFSDGKLQIDQTVSFSIAPTARTFFKVALLGEDHTELYSFYDNMIHLMRSSGIKRGSVAPSLGRNTEFRITNDGNFTKLSADNIFNKVESVPGEDFVGLYAKSGAELLSFTLRCGQLDKDTEIVYGPGFLRSRGLRCVTASYKD